MSDYVSTEKEAAIPFSDDEVVRDDELITEDEKPKAGETEEQKAARNERRRERGRTRERERKEAEDRAERLQAKLTESEQRIARLEGYVAAPRQAPAADHGDPFQKRLDAIDGRQRSEWAAYQAELKAGTLDEKRTKHYEAVSREIERDKIRVHTDQALAERDAREIPARRQEQAQQIWVQKYPEVYQNPKAFSYAAARVQQRVALGEPHTNDMNDEVFKETMTQFKLGKKSAPTPSERASYSGIPSSGSGGDGKGASGIQMTRDLKKIAEAMYSDLPPEKAHEKWVNSTGKKLREKRVI